MRQNLKKHDQDDQDDHRDHDDQDDHDDDDHDDHDHDPDTTNPRPHARSHSVPLASGLWLCSHSVRVAIIPSQ